MVGLQKTYAYLNKMYYFFLLFISYLYLNFHPFLGNMIICSKLIIEGGLSAKRAQHGIISMIPQHIPNIEIFSGLEPHLWQGKMLG